MKFEGFRVRAPADRSEGNGTSESKSESVERSSEGVYFESVGDLKKNLIPWMRSRGLAKVSVYAYASTTDREVGHFIVSFDRGRSEFIDRDGNQISLFGAPRSTIGRNSVTSTGRAGRLMRVEKWLNEKGVGSHTATFDVFTFEEGDEEQTQQEAVIEERAQEEGKTFAAVVESTALEQTPGADETSASEAEKAVRVKGPRKPRRKKPVKAERKARLAEGVRSQYANLLQATLDVTHRMNSVDESTHAKAYEALGRLAMFLDANASLKPEFAKALTSDTKYAEIRALLIPYKDEKYVSRSFRLSSAAKYVRKLAQNIFKESEHVDPFRSHKGMNWFGYESKRDLEDYGSLFVDIGSMEGYISYLHSQPAGRWLDIGSGETYRVPDSLMNSMRTINPRIKIVGLDPLYDEKLAAAGDRATGRHRLDETWAAKNELKGGTAQDIPFPDASFNEVLSFFAFDKFNESIGGTQQALREVARVLKVGGKARIYGLDLSGLRDDSILNTFFKQNFVMLVPEEVTDVGKPFAVVVLERVARAPSEEEEMRRASREWVARYAGETTAK